MSVFRDLADTAAKVRFGKEDEPDKYGYTKKMSVIADLADDGKPLTEADFKPNKYDEAYYEECKAWADVAAAYNGGKRKKMVRFVNDIDPD